MVPSWCQEHAMLRVLLPWGSVVPSWLGSCERNVVPFHILTLMSLPPSWRITPI